MFIVAIVVAVVAVVVVVADTSAGTTAGLLDVDVVDTTAAVADATAVGFVLLVDVVDVVTLLAWQMIHHVSFLHADVMTFCTRMI